MSDLFTSSQDTYKQQVQALESMAKAKEIKPSGLMGGAKEEESDGLLGSLMTYLFGGREEEAPMYQPKTLGNTKFDPVITDEDILSFTSESPFDMQMGTTQPKMPPMEMPLEADTQAPVNTETLSSAIDDTVGKVVEESTPSTVEDLEYTPEINLTVLDIPKAKGYKKKDVVSYSYYNKPLVEGGVRGNSRKGGDASEAVQKKAIQAIIKAGEDAGMSTDDIALTLAIARHESGFNPDAAAGTTSAHGLGQFVNNTGDSYGLTDDNRWDVDAQAKALVAHTIDNIKLAKSRGKPRSYVYKYHHDGPSNDYGGLATSTNKVMPYVDRFKKLLGVTMNEDTTPEESPRPRLRPAGLMSQGS